MAKETIGRCGHCGGRVQASGASFGSIGSTRSFSLSSCEDCGAVWVEAAPRRASMGHDRAADRAALVARLRQRARDIRDVLAAYRRGDEKVYTNQLWCEAQAEVLERAAAALAAPPEAIASRRVDDVAPALFEAPCLWCGYDGVGYWHTGTHARSCPWHAIGGHAERRVTLAEWIRAAARAPDCRAAVRAALQEVRDEVASEWGLHSQLRRGAVLGILDAKLAALEDAPPRET